MNTSRLRSLVGVLALATALVLAVPFATAEDFLSANDLQAAQILSVQRFDAFTIYAKADKGVTVEAMEEARTAADGEVFNARIKLNGGGALDYRSLGFSASEGAKLTVYLSSSSKTDARILKLCDSSGAVLAELSAPPDDGKLAGIASFLIPKAGDYFIFSAGSGINIYEVLVD